MNDIKDFRIGRANYLLENKSGGKIMLTVNYKDNKFHLVVLKSEKGMENLKHQAEIIAADMLSRKAKKNLVEKLLLLKI